ncbi:D-ribose pyranase [Arcanobacterium bovis]|uniref:D-ribose pyranase n=1 Tax=Arcanobacterium bovis TaxID=2529275 RepID=A0A4Q9V0T5_9ACTO|nr:D-ribose pyranase [Arcanobacterium bovis]TBW22206.1 D-ribose pyranase [Arcanobacterium bovis]
MKKDGILNPDLNRAIARLGHMDTFVVADCGLPIPQHVEVIDLALVFGIPRFTQVLDAVLKEVVIEGVTLAHEVNGTVAQTWVEDRVGNCAGTIEYVSHEDLKRQVEQASFVIRTGETTPYANVIFHCGVPF